MLCRAVRPADDPNSFSVADNSQVSIWSEKNTENTFVGGFTGGGFSGTPSMLEASAMIR